MSTEQKIKNIYRMVIAPDADVKIRDIAQKAMQAMRENGKIIFDDRNPDAIPVLVGRVHDMTSEKIYSSLAFNSFCIALYTSISSFFKFSKLGIFVPPFFIILELYTNFSIV